MRGKRAIAEERSQARLKAFEEVHDHWEFTAQTEAQFDRFLHKEIIRLRHLLELLTVRRRA